MQENCLEVRLEAEKERVGQFMLTAEAVSAHYAVSLDPERSFALSDALRRLGPALAGRGDPAKQLAPLELMREVGVRLWQGLLSDTAPAQEREALSQALRDGLSSLLLTLPDALAALPWELLCDPDVPGEQGFLARRRPLVRFLSSGSELALLAPPLRVLLLISSPISLGEDSRVDVESERTAVEEATREAREAGWLHLLVEDIVTPRRVQEALMRFRPHILHYIGHSDYNEQVGGVLLWEDDAGKELPIAASRLADLLRPRGLRTVVLHACQTARRDARTDSLGVAGTLVKVGIPAVLAQRRISPMHRVSWPARPGTRPSLPGTAVPRRSLRCARRSYRMSISTGRCPSCTAAQPVSLHCSTLLPLPVIPIHDSPLRVEPLACPLPRASLWDGIGNCASCT